MIRPIACIAAIAMLTIPIAAQRRNRQQDTAAAWRTLSARYDKNDDGKISKEEHGRGEQAFSRLDRDGDGFLTEADLGMRGRRRNNRGNQNARRDRSVMMTQRLARFADGDRDGRVTINEWKLYIASIDKSEDGELSDDELANVLMPARRRGRQGRGAQTRRRMRFASFLDTDGDGATKVTEVTALFAKLDTDKNDVLAGDELAPQPGRGRPSEADLPKVGKVAPDFTLPFIGQKDKTVTLSSHAGKKPVALIFGSYT
jgi:Ca2+-binding EF-hand superfamily protein